MTELSASVRKLLDAAADRNKVDRAIVRAVAWRESKGVQGVTSRKGAVGIMQLMPATAEALDVDPNDAEENIEGGARYLAQLIKRFGEADALAAYVWGEGNVTRKLARPNVVDQYVAEVLARRDGERKAAAVYIRHDLSTGRLELSPDRTYYGIIDAGVIGNWSERVMQALRENAKWAALDVKADPDDAAADRPWTYEDANGRHWVSGIPLTKQTVSLAGELREKLIALWSRAGVAQVDRTPPKAAKESQPSAAAVCGFLVAAGVVVALAVGTAGGTR